MGNNEVSSVLITGADAGIGKRACTPARHHTVDVGGARLVDAVQESAYRHGTVLRQRQGHAHGTRVSETRPIRGGWWAPRGAARW